MLRGEGSKQRSQGWEMIRGARRILKTQTKEDIEEKRVKRSIKRLRRVSMRAMRMCPWKRRSQGREDELPMYQEHYDALFSMDFMETKYPHVDT
ncbi:unnamed protein product [Microthlaspi erraticum]|uniref:Uncharacterized protein n=1 Tax=Microthlaspi erraticum TaxID=1685480 RepID=A0A6D2JS70_9BRAS|nr:unnamed protein product [Microthlaspi erraticum]